MKIQVNFRIIDGTDDWIYGFTRHIHGQYSGIRYFILGICVTLARRGKMDVVKINDDDDDEDI